MSRWFVFTAHGNSGIAVAADPVSAVQKIAPASRGWHWDIGVLGVMDSAVAINDAGEIIQLVEEDNG